MDHTQEEGGFTPIEDLENQEIYNIEINDSDSESEVGGIIKPKVVDKKWYTLKQVITSFVLILVHTIVLEQEFVLNLGIYKYFVVVLSAVVISILRVYI